MRKIKRYGCKPDLKDYRDLLYHESEHFAPIPLPPLVDLTDKLPACWDQGELGSCTGHGSVGAMVFIHPDKMFSRLDAYYNGRVIEGDVDQDAGAQIRDVVAGIANTGLVEETVWPYDISTFATPPEAVVDPAPDATVTKIANYYRIVDLNTLKTCLAQGFPVILGFTVFSNFELPDMQTTGILRTPGCFSQPIGGHCVLAVGYDEQNQLVKIRNSWGTGWGPFQGYFQMDYKYFKHLVSDMWTIRQ